MLFLGSVKRVKGEAKQDALIYVFNDYLIWCRVKPGSPPPLKLKSICALQHCSAADMGELNLDLSYSPPDVSSHYTQRFQANNAEVGILPFLFFFIALLIRISIHTFIHVVIRSGLNTSRRSRLDVPR